MTGIVLRAGELNRRIRIERPVADNALDGAGSGTWEMVCEVAAGVQDALPGRGERVADGITISNRPARIRLRYRTDISSAMRILVGRLTKDEQGNLVWNTDRVMQIVAGPAVIGDRAGLELVAEDYNSAGNPA